MHQNLGLICLTLGSIILSVSVFQGNYFAGRGMPWEQRLFYRLTGGRDMFDTKQDEKDYEKLMRCVNDEDYRKRMEKRKWRGRIMGDMPIIAIVMMIAGFFLSWKY